MKLHCKHPNEHVTARLHAQLSHLSLLCDLSRDLSIFGLVFYLFFGFLACRISSLRMTNILVFRVPQQQFIDNQAEDKCIVICRTRGWPNWHRDHADS